MKRPHECSSPSEARRSDGAGAAAALLIAQLEVARLEGALAVARRAVDDARTARAPAAAGTPSTEPPTAPSPSDGADAESTVFTITPPVSLARGHRQTWVYTARAGVDDTERLGNFCGLLGSALRPLVVLRREPPNPMPVAHVAALATNAAPHETPLNRLMSGLAIGQVAAVVGAGPVADSGQVGAAWARRGVLAARVAADVISTAARSDMDASRPCRRDPAAAPALDVFVLPNLLALILRLAASPDALLVTTRVARGARAVAPAVRKLIWHDRILKGTAILKGHAGEVVCCAFSPDGKRLVTASDDGTARLWDAETGALLTTLEGHDGGVLCCAFSPDGKRLVTSSQDRTARLWDAETGAPQATLEGHVDSVNCCAFSPDGKRLVTASDLRTAQLWDAETGALLMALEGHVGSVNCCAFSPDGKRLVTASDDKTARLWDAATGALQKTLEGHTRFVLCCAFSPDGKRLVTVGNDKTARLWDAETGALQKTLEGHFGKVNSCGFSPDGKRLATASDDETARLWDAATGALQATLEGHANNVLSCAFSPDGKRLVTASFDETARLWDAETGALETTLEGHIGGVKCCASKMMLYVVRI